MDTRTVLTSPNPQPAPDGAQSIPLAGKDWKSRLARLFRRIGVDSQAAERPESSIIFDFAQSQVVIPLRQDFSFRHEPASNEDALQFIGRVPEINELTARLLYSKGGTFLITGFRGVGKTSFINQVLLKLESSIKSQAPEAECHLVDIRMSLPRRLLPVELMHQIVRCLYLRLKEKKLLHRLNPDLEAETLLAFQRTSMVLERQRGTSRDFKLGSEATWNIPIVKSGIKFPFEMKRSRSESESSKFAPYDERSAEHDIIRLAQRLAGEPEAKPAFYRRIFGKEKPIKLKVILVFDELDKLDVADMTGETPGGNAAPPLDEILRSLKTLLTTSGMSFVFVAGKDLYDRWIEDVGGGDSIYESIFAYDKYLPCLWQDAKPLAETFIDLRSLSLPQCSSCRLHYQRADFFCEVCGSYLQKRDVARAVYDNFLLFLTYRGRGIPRRMWRAFHQSVKWYKGKPVVAFSAQEIRQHRVYAELSKLLVDSEQLLYGALGEDLTGEALDAPRLAAHYLIDWILRQGNSAFTEADLVSWSSAVSVKIMPTSFNAERLIGAIVAMLLRAGILEELKSQQRAEHRVIVEDKRVRVEETSPIAAKRFRLDPRRYKELGRGVADLPEDAGILKTEVNRSEVGNYLLLENLGAGGMGRVFRAIQRGSGRVTALKLLDEKSEWDNSLRERFQEEAKVLAALQHPNIVRFHESGEDGGRLYIAMDLIDGMELEALLKLKGKLKEEEILAVALPVIEAVEYLHSKGVIRNDLKPSNIMLSGAGRVYVIDLGTSKQLGRSRELTVTGAIIGTPAYMAPEQVSDSGIDHRCDLYAFGALLYAMATGHGVVEEVGIQAQLNAILNKDPIPPSHHNPDISSRLEMLILKCLSKNPDDRLSTAAAIQIELAAMNLDAPEANLGLLVAAARSVSVKEVKKSKASTQFPTIKPVARVREGGEFTQMFTSAPAPPPPSIPRFVPPAPIGFPPVGQFTMMMGPKSPEPPRRVPGVDDPFRTTRLPVLLVLEGPDITLGATSSIRERRFKIGRDSENHLVLGDETVSRFHAEILSDENGYWIEDHSSGNESYVDGERVVGQRELQPGALIKIGGYSLRFGL